MGRTLLAVIAIALVQGTLLRWLHYLADRDAGAWSELSFLLPAYACTVAVPLAYYLLRSKVRGAALVVRLLLVTVGLAGTASYVGWVNGPVESLYPSRAAPYFCTSCSRFWAGSSPCHS